MKTTYFVAGEWQSAPGKKTKANGVIVNCQLDQEDREFLHYVTKKFSEANQWPESETFITCLTVLSSE